MVGAGTFILWILDCACAIAVQVERAIANRYGLLPVFRSWVDAGSPGFGVAGFIPAPSVSIFLAFDPLWLIGFRSFLVSQGIVLVRSVSTKLDFHIANPEQKINRPSFFKQ